MASYTKRLLFLLSWLIVGFGQPVWGEPLSLVAACCGYALFWRTLLDCPDKWQRFFLGTAWFTAVQLVQLVWLVSHPYLYIYGPYLLLSLFLGLQFGLLSMLISHARIFHLPSLGGIAGLWTLFEWSRLFLFSGFTWNPVGLALTSNLYALQFASIGGIYWLSFWVMVVNLLFLRLLLSKNWRQGAVWGVAFAIPFLFGKGQLQIHAQRMEQEGKFLNVLLLHTAFPVEDAASFSDRRTTVSHVANQWHQMFQAIQPYQNQPIDLVLMPEYVVLCGTYSCVFALDHVKQTFHHAFGSGSLGSLPPLNGYFCRTFRDDEGQVDYVNNGFWAQGLANYLNAGVVVGMEDAEDLPTGREHYSSAQYFQPQSVMPPKRYDKRVLLPLGEYIPFEWCRKLAARYGVLGSFTPGKEAKLFSVSNVPFGLSICYEETFGDMMRESRQKGAELLVNLTSDVWYPYSTLARQHFDLARLRTVESGIPLIRSSNVGITAVVDSLGRIVHLEQEANEHQAVYARVPLYSYQTLYARWGDLFVVMISLIFAAFLAKFK